MKIEEFFKNVDLLKEYTDTLIALNSTIDEESDGGAYVYNDWGWFNILLDSKDIKEYLEGMQEYAKKQKLEKN